MWGGMTGGFQPKYLLTAGLTPKLCQVAQGLASKASTSPRVFISAYVRKNKGVSPAASVYENSDLRLVSISSIHSLALVILLKGER